VGLARSADPVVYAARYHPGCRWVAVSTVSARALEVLDPLVEQLSSIRRWCRFDVPWQCGGVTDSPLPGDGLSRYFGSRAGQLCSWKLLDSSGVVGIVLGFSWAGAACQQFAVQNPACCRRI